MPTQDVTRLMEEVAMLKNDIAWVKKGIYLCVATSMAAFLSVVVQIALHVVLH